MEYKNQGCRIGQRAYSGVKVESSSIALLSQWGEKTIEKREQLYRSEPL